MNVSVATHRRTVSLLAVLMALTAPATLCAHPRVQAGLERLNEADFRAALAAFDEAEAADDLTVADLEALLEGRAMAGLALGDDAAVTTALRRLAAIDPEHRFGAAAPPEIRASFERVGNAQSARLALSLRSRRETDTVAIEAEVAGDPGGLVRSVDLSARVPGGEWRRSTGRRLRLRAAPTDTVQAFATARGPGGAPVAAAGSAAAPIELAPPDTGPAGEQGAREHRGGAGAWVWIGAGAALVTAAIVLTVVAVSASGQSDRTQVSIPEVQR